MKSSAVDSVNTTLNGTLGHSETGASPLVFKLRVLYAGSVGITRADALLWDGATPLGVGRRSKSRPEGPWLRVEDMRASREHARLYKDTDGDGILIEDLGSRNGTWVNSTLLEAGKPHPLQDGDILRFADTFVMFRKEPQEVQDAPVPALIGVSLSACRIRGAIARCMATERTVLILGPTGTGKEVVAESIHRLGPRRGRLVSVNCAAVPATLAEAQLFGVKPGAFTGAVEQPGFFSEAEQGTLLLDEVGDLPLELQPKLLRALETRQVFPVGSSRPVARDVRILAATNRDLLPAIANKSFREDLYARLTSEVIELPLLRERREDILLLAQHFGTTDFRPSPRLTAAMLAYDWPFNVREVGNLVGRLRTAGEGEILAWLSQRPGKGAAEMAGADESASFKRRPGEPLSREQLKTLLEQHHGNLRRIALKSGYSRRQLARLAEKYNLDIDAYRQQHGAAASAAGGKSEQGAP